MNGLFVFLAGLAVRIVLIHLHPVIFGGDTVLRLANRDRVLLAYQLPLLQAAIYSVSAVFDSVLAVRYLMAVIGALAGLGFYRLAGRFLEDRHAFYAAMLFVASPFLLQLSIVPYQEVLMLGALLFAFDFHFRGNVAAASAALGLACLTRYEAWAACPVLAFAYAAERGWRMRTIAEASLLFGWAPLVWTAAHGGFSAGGTYVVEAPASPARLMRYVYLGWITVKNTPAPVLILAALGFWRVWRGGLLGDSRVRLLLAFLTLFLLAILFSAHGESPDPERFVTSREATLWIAAVTLAAGFGIGLKPRIGKALAGAGVVVGLVMTHLFLIRDTSLPHVRLSYDLARYLDARLEAGERAAVLTRPIPAGLVQAYLDKVSRRGGPPALERARRILASMDTSPPDYQRTLIHSGLGRDRLLPGPAPEAEWLAVWSDAGLHIPEVPTATLRAGSVSVMVYSRKR